jgi:hypothetical protein
VSGHVLPFFAAARTEVGGFAVAAQHQHPGGKNRGTFYQNVRGKVQLVVECAIKLGCG